MVNKLAETGVIIRDERPYLEIDPSYTKHPDIMLYADFFNSFDMYLRYELKHKSLSEPTIRLVLVLFSLNKYYKPIQIASNLLNKSQFFVFKDCMEQFFEIVKVTIELSYSILTRERKPETEFDGFRNNVRACIKSISSYTKPNKQLLNTVQSILFTELIAKEVKEHTDEILFYDAIEGYFDVFDFQVYPAKEEIIGFLEIVKLVTEPSVVDLIQDNDIKYYHQQNYFYVSVYTALAKLFESRSDLAKRIEPDVCKMLSYFKQIDCFDDPTKSV